MRFMSTGAEFTVVEVGYMRATAMEPAERLCAGEVGYITASIKTVRDAQVGDTVTLANNPAAESLPGYRRANPMVFCGVYPADARIMRRCAMRWKNCSSTTLPSPMSRKPPRAWLRLPVRLFGAAALGIIQERLEREYDLDLVTTIPSVVYRIHMTDGDAWRSIIPPTTPIPQGLIFVRSR